MAGHYNLKENKVDFAFQELLYLENYICTIDIVGHFPINRHIMVTMYIRSPRTVFYRRTAFSITLENWCSLRLHAANIFILYSYNRIAFYLGFAVRGCIANKWRVAQS